MGEHGKKLVFALVGVSERFLHPFAFIDVGYEDSRTQQGSVGSADRVEIAQPRAILAGERRAFRP